MLDNHQNTTVLIPDEHIKRHEVSSIIVGMLCILIEHKTDAPKGSPESMLNYTSNSLGALFDVDSPSELIGYIYSQIELSYEDIIALGEALEVNYKQQGLKYALSVISNPDADIGIQDILCMSASAMIMYYLKDVYKSILEHAELQTHGRLEQLLEKVGDVAPRVAISTLVFRTMSSRLALIQSEREDITLREVHGVSDCRKAEFESFLQGDSGESPQSIGSVQVQFKDGVFAVLVCMHGAHEEPPFINVSFYADCTRSFKLCSYSTSSLVGKFEARRELSDHNVNYELTIY
jgi:hypothetical protein